MSQASTGPNPAPAPPAGGADQGPGGAVVPRRGDAVAARPGGWAPVAARFAPPGAAAAAMAVLGIWGLARDSSMGNDEVATRWAALLGLHQLAHLLNTVDAVHGLYYLLMHGWVAVGSSPAVLRIPSLSAMVAAVALTVILARRLTGSGWAGLFAGLTMALTPSISYYAQTARSYAFVLACVVAATLALVAALGAEAPGTAGGAGPRGDAGPVVARRWLAYGALVTLCGYLNELSLLVLAAHAVTVLLARRDRQALRDWPALRHWAATATAAAVLVLPLIVISMREQGAVNWIPRPGLADIRILFQDYFGATIAGSALLLVCAVAAVLPATAPGGAAAGPDRQAQDSAKVPWWRGGVSLPSAAVPLLLVPAVLLFGESLVGAHLYVDRYVLYGEAGAALLAGAGMYRIGRWLAGVTGRRELAWALGAVVCVLALVLQIAPQQRVRTPQSRAYDFGAPSRYVGAHARPGDGVLFFDTFYRKARLGYPADFARTKDFAMAVSPQQAGTFRGHDKPFPLIGPLMLRYQRIWVLGRLPSAQLASPQLRSESLELQAHFTLTTERRFRGLVVTLWQRR